MNVQSLSLLSASSVGMIRTRIYASDLSRSQCPSRPDDNITHDVGGVYLVSKSFDENSA